MLDIYIYIRLRNGNCSFEINFQSIFNPHNSASSVFEMFCMYNVERKIMQYVNLGC